MKSTMSYIFICDNSLLYKTCQEKFSSKYFNLQIKNIIQFANLLK